MTSDEVVWANSSFFGEEDDIGREKGLFGFGFAPVAIYSLGLEEALGIARTWGDADNCLGR